MLALRCEFWPAPSSPALMVAMLPVPSTADSTSRHRATSTFDYPDPPLFTRRIPKEKPTHERRDRAGLNFRLHRAPGADAKCRTRRIDVLRVARGADAVTSPA